MATRKRSTAPTLQRRALGRAICSTEPHPKDARAYAHEHARQGIAELAHALNACSRVGATYRYANRHQQRFMRLMQEVYDLIENGTIVALPLPCAPTESEHDSGFQRFMAGLGSVVPDRAGS